MRRTGNFLMGLGAFVGVLVALASAGQLAIVGISWLTKVALVKLGIVGAAALLASGAFTVRVARQREADVAARVGPGEVR